MTSMIIVIVVYILLLVNYSDYKLTKNAVGWENGVPPCPQHQWVYGPDNFLVCEKCKKRPGIE